VAVSPVPSVPVQLISLITVTTTPLLYRRLVLSQKSCNIAWAETLKLGWMTPVVASVPMGLIKMENVDISVSEV
jgi:hypothetical protein